MSLKHKTISGIFWSLLQNLGGKGITFIITIILARLLTPKIFGLIGMLMIFIQISQTLVQAGFNQALIQKNNTDEEDYSSVFWINLVVCILIYVCLFVASPLISSFYDQPILTDLSRAFGLVFVINAFSYVQEARLTKEMRFKTITVIHIPSTIIGGVVSIAMALMDYGVWSLIAQQLVTRLAYAIQIWIYAKWKPLFLFNKAKAKALFKYGNNLMLSGIISTVFDNIYLIVIGKFFPINMVGYYQNANNLVQQPTRSFSAALSKVTFSVFSSIQNDDEKLKLGYKKSIQQMVFWVCPLFIFAGVLADPIFHLVFGLKWLPAVPFFQILCIEGVLFPLNSFNLNIVKVKGRTDLFLKLSIIKRSITIIGVFAIIFFSSGIWYLLFFQAAGSIFAYYINSYFSGKYINYPIKEQIFDILPIIISGLFIGFGVWVIDLNLHSISNTFRVAIGFILGGSIYWLIARMRSFEPYLDVVHLIKKKRSILQ